MRPHGGFANVILIKESRQKVTSCVNHFVPSHVRFQARQFSSVVLEESGWVYHNGEGWDPWERWREGGTRGSKRGLLLLYLGAGFLSVSALKMHHALKIYMLARYRFIYLQSLAGLLVVGRIWKHPKTFMSKNEPLNNARKFNTVNIFKTTDTICIFSIDRNIS